MAIKTKRSEKVSREAVARVLRDRMESLELESNRLVNLGKFLDAVEYKIRRDEVQVMLNTMLLRDF